MSTSNCQDILDAWILVENKVVTYKLLSRLTRVHVRQAKAFMAQWHETHPQTHATYVLYGQRIAPDDEHSSELKRSIPSSSSNAADPFPPASISAAEGDTHTIRLAPQEDLEKVKQEFSKLLSCQIYSLEPARLTDISLLMSCKHDVDEAMKGQSTKIADLSRTYGVIFNAEVHELDENPNRHVAPDREVKPILKVQQSVPRQPVVIPQPALVKKESSNASVKEVPGKQPVLADKKLPALKRNASSSLASAFAKTPKPKVKLLEAHPAPEVSKITIPLESVVAAADPQEIKRKAEDDALKQMMLADDDDDDLDEDVFVPDVRKEDTEVSTVPSKDEEMLDPAEWSASDTEMPDVVPIKVAEPVRKRTRKKVKRQVHTKDAKGYMVTKEEWEWISCDEDEVSVPSLGRQISSSTSNKVKVGPKKKTGPGGIANYFTKK